MVKISNYAGTITFNGKVLKLTRLTPTKQQKTRKSVVGKTIVEAKVIGLADQQWRLVAEGLVTGTSSDLLAANRGTVEALDDATPHALVDGIHNGTYICVPGSMRFDDSGDMGNMSYLYSIEFVEE